MNFDYSKIKNPIFHFDKYDLRDPAVFIHEEKVYLYFTWYDAENDKWYVGMTQTEDFINFSEVKIITPPCYASPGNIMKVENKFIICFQRYGMTPNMIALAWSEDLVNWSEPELVFNTGAENKWNLDVRTIDPYIVKHDRQYYCFYTGSKPPVDDKCGCNLIGLAKSPDLKNWQDISLEKPALDMEYEWEKPDGVENNCVIRLKNGKWFMLYSASLRNQKIAWATSNDLISWEKGGLCNIPEFPGATCKSAPFIIENLSDENTWHLLYHSADPDPDRKNIWHQNTSFYLLESKDLINWY
jgi:predicted GH43/DUF377 family glycosyl hydrolase